MTHYGAVEIEGDPSNPKVVSELKDHSVKNKHLDTEDVFTFKNIVLEDEFGKKFKIKVKDKKIELEELED